MLDLRGRGALLIGVRRLGEVVARRLAQEGVALALAYRSSREDASRLRDAIAPQVPCALLQGDATVEADATRLMQEAKAGLGDLSFVVNMASDYPRAPLKTLDLAAYERGMAGARAAYLLSVAAARAMAGNPGPTRGHILHFGDWAAGETPYKDYLPYLTSKAAVHFMGRAFAVELAPQGILVNTLAPGPAMRPPDIPLPLWERDTVGRTPLKRESSPEELAELVVTLLKSETITGELIRVDSGRHLVGPGGGEGD